jgi:2-(3-amino-3-carboxypropyl)histidine synthase
MFEERMLGETLKLLKRKKARRVLIQVPEGLKTGVQRLANFLEKNGFETLISIEPCFGACDLRDREAKALGCDTLLHLGHASMDVKAEVPVVYYEYPIEYDFIPVVRIFLKQIKFRKICVVSTVQFLNALEKAVKFMEENGFEVYNGGKILGCDASGPKKHENVTECFLFIGSGRFHPLGLQEKTDKPVLFLDIENRTLENLLEEKNKMEIRRKLRIEKARGMKSFGILVSTKPGQNKIRNAFDLKEKLKKTGRDVYILAGDYFTAEKLLGLKIDVLVNTSCPRIRDDYEQFNKIIFNPEDAEEMIAADE